MGKEDKDKDKRVNDLIYDIKREFNMDQVNYLEVGGKDLFYSKITKEVMGEALMFLNPDDIDTIGAGGVIFDKCVINKYTDNEILDLENPLNWQAALALAQEIEKHKLDINLIDIEYLEGKKKTNKLEKEILKKFEEVKDALKIKNANILILKDEYCFLKKPDRNHIGAATKFMTKIVDGVHKPNVLKSGETLLKKTFIHKFSNNKFIEEDDYVWNASIQLVSLIKLQEEEQKKS